MLNSFKFYFLIFIFFQIALSVSKAQDQHEQNIGKDSVQEKTLSPADYLLLKVENIHHNLDRINSLSHHKFNTSDIESELPDVAEQLLLIKYNISTYQHVPNVKNLQMSRKLLAEIQDQLKGWRESLFDLNSELIKMKSEISEFGQDSLLRAISKDTLYKELYAKELTNLKGKWDEANFFTDSNITRISNLQQDVSKHYFDAIQQQYMLKEQLGDMRAQSWGKEYLPLYNPGAYKISGFSAQELFNNSFKAKSRMLNFYIQMNTGMLATIAIATILFFYWVYKNFKKIPDNSKEELLKNKINFQYLKPVPVMAGVIFFLNVAPFIDFTPPSAYVEAIQLMLIAALTVVFYRSWDKKLLKYWYSIVIFFILFAITNTIFTSSFIIRYFIIGLNAISIYFGILFLKKKIGELSLPAFVKVVTVIYILLNLLALITNILGRLSLTKTFSLTGIYGLIQVIGLSVFIHILLETLQLQLFASRVSNKAGGNFNYDKILKTFNKIFIYFMVVMWIVVFTTNLGIYPTLHAIGEYILYKPRVFGSTTFNIANLVFFVAILYITNFIQKYIGYFLGETDDYVLTDKRGSRLVILKLILLLIGFFLAITASGLPMDKITIVLGALGVGIGLGLQNIVNNFVSGIIIIFESPFKIGDSIQLNDKKGVVRNIGIRASKIMTAEGSEITMPNGDLLSGQVINYSTNNNSLRTEITLKIEPASLEAARECILEVLNTHEEVSRRINPEVYIHTITNVSMEIKGLFWLKNSRKEQATKTQILMLIFKKFNERNIKLI